MRLLAEMLTMFFLYRQAASQPIIFRNAAGGPQEGVYIQNSIQQASELPAFLGTIWHLNILIIIIAFTYSIAKKLDFSRVS